MKALKIIIWIVVGFIIGISYMPIKFWYDEKKYANVESFSTCDTRPKEELIPLIKRGDTIAYDELRIYFSCQDNNPEELLPYAFLMANKYNYKSANFDVYYCFWRIYCETSLSLSLLDSLDQTTRNLALEYLQMGAELGDKNSMNKLGGYYYEGKVF